MKYAIRNPEEAAFEYLCEAHANEDNQGELILSLALFKNEDEAQSKSYEIEGSYVVLAGEAIDWFNRNMKVVKEMLATQRQ